MPWNKIIYYLTYWNMSEENTAVDTVETTKTAEELEAALKKAEAKIVEMKKSATPEQVEAKEETSEAPATVKPEDMEKFYEERKFFESNPDLLEHADKLKEYNSKGIGWDEAKALVELKDPTIANRKVAKKMNFTAGDIPADSTVSNKELESMSQEDYTKARDLMKAGKLKLVD